ncbi:MAG: secondary thiamine-phosphate synthase enzyme YjbQ [bacterium]|nr:secondary thiamine-phosphate synthase enzyme YjbQ [bacterium]
MLRIAVATRKAKEVVDITDQIEEELENHSFENGTCILFLTHTTAAITCADLDPGTDLDMLDAFENLVPNLKYRHPHNPAHVSDHILSSLLGSSLALPVEKGELQLGAWQRVVLLEFSGPRKREIILCLLPEKD